MLLLLLLYELVEDLPICIRERRPYKASDSRDLDVTGSKRDPVGEKVQIVEIAAEKDECVSWFWSMGIFLLPCVRWTFAITSGEGEATRNNEARQGLDGSNSVSLRGEIIFNGRIRA
jgi:hypothetical protein